MQEELRRYSTKLVADGGMPIEARSLQLKNRVRGRWNNNVYRIQLISALKIFDKTDAPTVSGFADTVKKRRTVPASTDTVMTDTVGKDTNHTHEENKNVNVNDFKKFAIKRSLPSMGGDYGRVANLVEEVLKTCGDSHSRKFYLLIAKRAPADLIFAALSETRHQARASRIRKSRGAFFTDELMRLSSERRIDLRISTPSQENTW